MGIRLTIGECESAASRYHSVARGVASQKDRLTSASGELKGAWEGTAADEWTHRIDIVANQVEQGVADMDSELREVTPALDRAVIRLRRWVDRDGGGRVSAEVLAEARALAERGAPEVRALASLAAECRGLHLPFDEEIISQRLERLRALLVEIS